MKILIVLLFFSVVSQAAEVGDRVCSDEKNGWCGFITQVLGKSLKIENYTVTCTDGGFLGICTNVSMGSCGGTERLFTSDSGEDYKNPKSIIVPSSCIDGNDRVVKKLSRNTVIKGDSLVCDSEEIIKSSLEWAGAEDMAKMHIGYHDPSVTSKKPGKWEKHCFISKGETHVKVIKEFRPGKFHTKNEQGDKIVKKHIDGYVLTSDDSSRGELFVRKSAIKR